MVTSKHTLLRDSPPENVFWVFNGGQLKNIKELVAALEKMDDATFRYHVNPEKNDFGNWIKNIFKDEELTKKLEGVMDKDRYVSVLRDRILEVSPKKAAKKKK